MKQVVEILAGCAIAAVLVMSLVGCGSSDPRISAAQKLAISEAVTSNRMHNRLHAKEQEAYGLAKMNETQRVFERSIDEAVADAEADPQITKRALADEVVKRTATRDANLAKAQAVKELMRRAQAEANKPMATALEAAGVVQQYHEAEGFSYTELIEGIGEVTPKP